VEKMGNLRICTLYITVGRKQGGKRPFGNLGIDGG
jgi:hypothetical protein